jgi:hypothetical protein
MLRKKYKHKGSKKAMIEKSISVRKKFKCCYGISSNASEDNLHCLFLDYDNVSYETVIEHLQYLQQEYLLGDMYLIESIGKDELKCNSFNAICLDVLPLALCHLIGNDVFSPCDRNFFKYGFKRGYYTLRFDCNKDFLGVISSEHRQYKKSLAHKKWLEWFFDIEIPLDNSFNDYGKICLVQFPSTKNGYHIVDKKLPSCYSVMKND